MQLSRRQLLVGGGCALATATLTSVPFIERRYSPLSVAEKNSKFVPPDSISVSQRPTELAYLAPFVDKQAKWEAENLFKFLNATTEEHLLPLGRSLFDDKDNHTAFEDFQKKEKPAKIESIHREILWQSSSIISYPVKSLESIDYHGIVVWCSGKLGIPENEARFTSTFELEQKMLQRQFIDVWNRLDPQQHQKLLAKIDPGGTLEKDSAIAGMSGAAALAALSSTVYLAGFAFYTTMSVVICTGAELLGVTLPFSAYMTASSTIAVLAGPIGWAIGALFLGATIAAWAGEANVRKSSATVIQLHCMKAGALYGAGMS